MHPLAIAGVDSAVACWAHCDAAAEAVRALKYGRRTALVSALADTMAMIAPTADLITWVPATNRRRRRRMFDQAELLARAVGRRRAVPVQPLMRRRDSRPQTARTRAGRMVGPELVLAPGSTRRIVGRTVLVVDDVSTTGSTLRRAACVLRDGGAGGVVAVVATVAAVGVRRESGPRAGVRSGTRHLR